MSEFFLDHTLLKEEVEVLGDHRFLEDPLKDFIGHPVSVKRGERHHLLEGSGR
jgi:hypothetical protein